MESGDIVKLKSGGPKMVVEDRPWGEPPRVLCVWFKDGKSRRCQFPLHGLRKVASKW